MHFISMSKMHKAAKVISMHPHFKFDDNTINVSQVPQQNNIFRKVGQMQFSAGTIRHKHIYLNRLHMSP